MSYPTEGLVRIDNTEDLTDVEPDFISRSKMTPSYASQLARATQDSEYFIGTILFLIIGIVGLLIGLFLIDGLEGNFFAGFFVIYLIFLVFVYFDNPRRRGNVLYKQFKNLYGENLETVSTLSKKFVKHRIPEKDIEYFFGVDTIIAMKHKHGIYSIHSDSGMSITFNDAGFTKGSTQAFEDQINEYIQANKARERQA
ncbi:MAG: hypothetical protein Q4E22_01765 [Coriobacteriia bacterium]|nr:hypothetical protein [Coriobacteriia bacterium]